METLYFDNSATTQVDEDVARIAYEVMTRQYGNPSSPYHLGREALQILTKARHQIAMCLSVPTAQVYFTSGGTESNNLAILGAAEAAGKGRVITTAIEHASVLDPVKRLGTMGFDSVVVRPRDGVIQARDVIDGVNQDTILVSVMAVNNETGEILPVKEIIDGVRRKNPRTLIHCDCVQGFGKLPFKAFEYDADMISVSAHKLHAPKGVGALYVKQGVELIPRRFGGGQESRLRPGTEPVPLAAAFGYASEKALRHMAENSRHAASLRQTLLERLAGEPRISINSPERCSPYLINISVRGIPTDTMLDYLRMRNIYTSGSSACSKGAKSHVIQAMELGEERARTVLRIGLGRNNTEKEVQLLADGILSGLDEIYRKEGAAI